MAFTGSVFGGLSGLAIASIITGHPYVAALQFAMAGVNLGLSLYLATGVMALLEADIRQFLPDATFIRENF